MALDLVNSLIAPAQRNRRAGGCTIDLSKHYPQEKFPMMVLPIGKALELSEVPMHEDILEHLVEWQPGMNTIFISHTWNRRAHPDSENNCKWALLKSFLKTALAGQKNIDPDPVTAMVYGRKLRVEG